MYRWRPERFSSVVTKKFTSTNTKPDLLWTKKKTKLRHIIAWLPSSQPSKISRRSNWKNLLTTRALLSSRKPSSGLFTTATILIFWRSRRVILNSKFARISGKLDWILVRLNYYHKQNRSLPFLLRRGSY